MRGGALLDLIFLTYREELVDEASDPELTPGILSRMGKKVNVQ